jgi:hypothetical protein
MASRGRAENAALADDELADAVGSGDLGDELGDLRVPVTAISANDKSAILDTFGDGQEDAGDEGLAVVWLLEDLDFLAQARPGYVSLSSETAVGEDFEALFLNSSPSQGMIMVTYVPGFWSANGVISTVLTSMAAEEWG